MNKCDVNTKRFEKVCEELRAIAHTKVISISARDSINLDQLVFQIKDLVRGVQKPIDIPKNTT